MYLFAHDSIISKLLIKQQLRMLILSRKYNLNDWL